MMILQIAYMESKHVVKCGEHISPRIGKRKNQRTGLDIIEKASHFVSANQVKPLATLVLIPAMK